MIDAGLLGLAHGFSVALVPQNLMWCLIGVFVGNVVGVLPGMGVLSTISILLPLTFSMHAGRRAADAVGHLLRRAVWRGHLLHPAEPALPSARTPSPAWTAIR